MRDLDSELYSLGLSAGEYVYFDGTKFTGATVSSSNIGNSDLTIDTAARTLSLNGATGSDSFTIDNGTNPLAIFRGNRDIELYTANANGLKIFQAQGTNSKILAFGNVSGQGVANIGLSVNQSYFNLLQGGGSETFRVDGVSGNIKQYGNVLLQGSGARKLILGGALSTDSFSIRNSADTKTLFEIDGLGETSFLTDSSSVLHRWYDSNTVARTELAVTTSESLFSLTSAAGTNRLRSNTSTSQWMQNWWGGNIGLGFTTTKPTGGELNVLGIKNGTAPSSSYTDAIQIYSADESAGNACPHFRTEGGDVVKLYQESALTASDGTLANAVTRIGEIETALQNLGLLA